MSRRLDVRFYTECALDIYFAHMLCELNNRILSRVHAHAYVKCTYANVRTVAQIKRIKCTCVHMITIFVYSMWLNVVAFFRVTAKVPRMRR